MPLRRAGAAATATALALTVLGATPVWAALSAVGRTTAGQSAASGAWGVVPTTSATAPASPSALTLTFPATNNGNTPQPAQYFNVINSRSLGLTAATYGLSQSDTTQFVVEACSGAWTTSSGACSGTISSVVSTTAGTTAGSASSATVPAAAGSTRQLRLRPTTGNASTSTTCTISVSVSRAGVRAATTTGS